MGHLEHKARDAANFEATSFAIAVTIFEGLSR